MTIEDMIRKLVREEIDNPKYGNLIRQVVGDELRKTPHRLAVTDADLVGPRKKKGC